MPNNYRLFVLLLIMPMWLQATETNCMELPSLSQAMECFWLRIQQVTTENKRLQAKVQHLTQENKRLQNDVTKLTDAVQVAKNGNVGIGTRNPKATLQVWNNDEYNGKQSPTGQDSIILRGAVNNSTGKYFGGITWFDGGSRRRVGISSVMEYFDSDHVGLAFFTHGTDGPGPMSESMRITRNGNVGIGTTSPGAKLHVNGNFIRTIAYATGNGPQDGTNVGQIKSRVLRFTKAKAATKLRISYTDNFSTHGERLSSCRWEIRVNGNSCPNQKLIYDDISATGDYTHTDHTVVGYCSGIKAGSHTIEVWVNSSASPNPGSGNCQTGWNNSTWVLEAEEVN